MPVERNPDEYYIVREQQAGWQYSGPTSPSQRKIIKGVGPVFRNKMKTYGYVVVETTSYKTYREAMFAPDVDLGGGRDNPRGVHAEMFFGTNRTITWDPKDDIMKHSQLAKMRNLEVLNLHLKEVIDALTLGIGEVPKVEISDNAYYSAGNDRATLKYENVTVEVHLNHALRGH